MFSPAGERVPLVRQSREFFLARVGEAVVLAGNAALGRFPPDGDKSCALEAVEDGIERAVGDLESTVGALGHRRDDLVSVGFAEREQMQHDQLERTAFQLALDPFSIVFSPRSRAHKATVSPYVLLRKIYGDTDLSL